MKKVLLLLALFVSSFAIAQETQQTFYTCVMHPEIHSPKPGKCPKCGMNLIKEKPKAVKKKTVIAKP
ncbi:MAG: heavy metal-binding domain-containing protein, partial [Bacteroidota bacterium]